MAAATRLLDESRQYPLFPAEIISVHEGSIWPFEFLQKYCHADAVLRANSGSVVISGVFDSRPAISFRAFRCVESYNSASCSGSSAGFRQRCSYTLIIAAA